MRTRDVLDVPMYSDNELRSACARAAAEATARERKRIRPFVVVLRHSAMSKHPVACAALLAAADQLADLLDGDDDADPDAAAAAAHREICPACLVALPHHQTKCQYRGLGADEIHQSMTGLLDGDGDAR